LLQLSEIFIFALRLSLKGVTMRNVDKEVWTRKTLDYPPLDNFF
jgi:hypothetical protein